MTYPIIINRVGIQSIEYKQMLVQVCCLSSYLLVGLSVSLSVCLSVCLRWVNCGKTADWIWMPFGVVSGDG